VLLYDGQVDHGTRHGKGIHNTRGVILLFASISEGAKIGPVKDPAIQAFGYTQY